LISALKIWWRAGKVADISLGVGRSGHFAYLAHEHLSLHATALPYYWQSEIIIKPPALLLFHNAPKMRKYRLLYSPIGGPKQGPKAPSSEVIKTMVETKQRNASRPAFPSRQREPGTTTLFSFGMNFIGYTCRYTTRTMSRKRRQPP
jgi:hypothetical protein